MNRLLTITTGKTTRGGAVETNTITWEALATKLKTFRRVKTTLADYRLMSTDQRANVKDSVGFFIGGAFSNSTRKKAAMTCRSILTLDVDALPESEFSRVPDVCVDYAHVMHTTASHTVQKPKFRLVFPFTRDVTLEEYEPIARRVAEWLSIDAVDRVSFRPSQVMFWPVCCADGTPLAYSHEGSWLDPDDVLATYEDWHDFGEWPVSAAEGVARKAAQVMEDPVSKQGVIGAFCRAFDIREAIAHFNLPYTPTDFEDRYTPAGATGSQGAVIYASELCSAAFIYSHHSHDVAASRCLNSWDLVRLCKFPGLPDKESQQEMIAFANTLPEVAALLADRALDFDPVDDDGEPAPAPKRFSYDSLWDEVNELSTRGNRTRLDCRAMLARIASAQLDVADEGALLNALRDCYPGPVKAPTKAELFKDLQRLRKQTTGAVTNQNDVIEDLAVALIKEVLREHYHNGKHLRRAGKMFWLYERGCWRPTEDEQIKGAIISTVVRLRIDRPEDKIAALAAVAEAPTAALVNSIWSLLPSMVAKRHSDKDPLGLRSERAAVINCRNGELHLNKHGVFELKPHNPESFLTAQVPVDYDPEALCPEWDTFCGYLFQDALEPDEMQRHLEELGGYLIQPTRWLRTWVLFHGPTAAGKTTIGRVLGNLLGHSAARRPLSAYDGRNSHAEAGLVGKLMLLDEDFDKGGVLPDGFIKKISEAKELTANPKSKDEFSFMCRALPVVISNSWPATRDVSDALIDRALVFDFQRQLMGVHRDDLKADRMANDELPGILSRFVAGFERLRKRGKWLPPYECLVARSTWVTQSNAVGRFLSECAQPSKTDHVKASLLWEGYKGWMLDAMPGTRKVGRGEFLDRCVQVLGPRRRVENDWVFDGYVLTAGDYEDMM